MPKRDFVKTFTISAKYCRGLRRFVTDPFAKMFCLVLQRRKPPVQLENPVDTPYKLQFCNFGVVLKANFIWQTIFLLHLSLFSLRC
jgi:hypothetical protein